MPNQQQKDFIPWLVKNFGKKFYLIGSNYIYPKEENNVCKILLKQLGGEVVGEEYVPLGHSEFASVINKFQDSSSRTSSSPPSSATPWWRCIGSTRPPASIPQRCRWRA